MDHAQRLAGAAAGIMVRRIRRRRGTTGCRATAVRRACAGRGHGAARPGRTASPAAADGLTGARRTRTARRSRTLRHHRATTAGPRRVLGSCAPGARPLPRGRRAVHVHAGDVQAVQAAQGFRGGRPAAWISRDRPVRGRLDRVRGCVAGGLPSTATFGSGLPDTLRKTVPVHGGAAPGAPCRVTAFSGTCLDPGAGCARRPDLSAASTSRGHTKAPPRANTTPAMPRRTWQRRQRHRVRPAAASRAKTPRTS